ncbi:MAG: ECF transporter S component [Clostridia bacterium]|nr:ECF transporter S component [Clostridia bacterium]
MSQPKSKFTDVRTLVAVGVFAALAFVCCVLFHFKAAFLSFDLKDAVMAIGAMLFGPVYGFAMALIVCIIESLTISTTEVYGFIMNVLSSTVFVCVGSLVYSRKRTMTGALVGIILSVVTMVVVMICANLVITPYYMGVTRGEVAALIPALILPFNITKGVVNASLVFLLYKPLSTALKHAGFRINSMQTGGVKPDKRKSLAVTVIAAVLCAAACLYFFLCLGGKFSFK